MKCESFVKEHLPAIRSLLAKELTSKGLTQQEAADKLYLTQPAVAFYKGQNRGKKAKEIKAIPGVKEKIEELTKRILLKQIEKLELEKEYCSFCRMIAKE
jgi:predicted transcriptional regulator